MSSDNPPPNMGKQAPPGTHRNDLESKLATLLTIGTGISAAVLFIGMMIYLRNDHTQVLKFDKFTPKEESGLIGVFRNAAQLDGASIMQLGVVLLILTPVTRVLFTLVAFLFKRDWLYVAVTAVVLSVLMYGLFGGTVHP